MIDFSIFQGGQNRVVLPFYEMFPLTIIPTLALTLLITTTRIQENRKQILSVPLLATLFFVPFGFTNGNRLLDLAVSCSLYNLFLRFLELFWIGPLVLHRPVYTSFDDLCVDFWSCVRIHPKPAKENAPTIKKDEPVKDKTFLHIILYMCTHLVIADVVSSWICSFTRHEAVTMMSERPVLFLWYFLASNVLINSVFNSVGYMVQLFYCIVLEGGRYSSAQWRPLMMNPVLSESLGELWSTRWHQIFKSTWLAFAFRPVRALALQCLTKRTQHARAIAFMLASLSVFLASSLMHEYVIAANVGLSIYTRFFIGQQSLFFMFHGIGVVLEHAIKLKNPIAKHAWVVAFGYLTFYFFLNGFITWGLQKDHVLTFTKPYIIQFAKTHPPLYDYFGSQQ